MTEENKIEGKKGTSGRKAWIAILSVVIVAALAVTGVLLLSGGLYPAEGAAEEQLRRQMLDESTKEITVTGTLYLHGPVEVSGEKILKGDGKLKSVGLWLEDSADYLLVLQEGTSLTLSGDVTLDCNGRSGGVLACKNTTVQLQEQAAVSNAHKSHSNVRTEGTYIMSGGALKDARGHNLYISGAATLGGGEIIGSGEGYAGVYNEGTLEQSGGTVRDAYDNVYVAANACFTWSGGDNNTAVNDGIVVAEGASLTSNSLGAMMNDAGKQGIHLYGKAVIDDVFVIGSGENQVKVESTGELTLNNGAFDGSKGHGITNRGTMVMYGGEVTNSAQAGIVCTGQLEITGGRVYASEEIGILLRNGSNAKIHGNTFSATGNSVGVLVEENAYVEVFECNINSNDIYNFGSYGEMYLHDLTTGGSGSNCIAAQYGGKIKAENITISGTVANNGIYNVNGSTVELYNVTIDAAKTNGIRTLDATLIAENLTVTSCGAAGISMGDYEFQGAGKVTVSNVTMDNNDGANLAMDFGCTGTMEVTNATLGKSGSNNISAKGGLMQLTDVEILGNIEKDASNHGILLDEGCKIVATNLTIRNTLKSAMRIRGGDFEGTNVVMENLGASGISSVTGPTYKTNGTIVVNGLTVTNAKENTIISDCDGSITVSNATLGATWSNNVRINNGAVSLSNVKILGNTAETKSESEHAVFITKGTLYMNGVSISGAKGAGLRFGGGTATAKNLTIHNSGSSGIYITSANGDSTGKLTIQDLTISGSKLTNISLLGDTSVSITDATLEKTPSNNIRINNGSMRLADVTVKGQTEDPKSTAEHGIFIDGGKLTFDGVSVSETVGSGIRHKGGVMEGTDLTLTNCGVYGISSSNGVNPGSFTVTGLNISGSGSSNIHTDSEHLISVTDAVLDVTSTNNVRVVGGKIFLTNVEILGTEGDGNHGIFNGNGTVTAKDLRIRNTCDALRLDGGLLEVDGGTLTNSRRHGVNINNGELRLQNITIDGIKEQGIYSYGEGGVLAAENVNIVNVTGNGIGVDQGEISLNNVTVSAPGKNGIRVTNGTVSGTNVCLENIGETGILAEKGEAVVDITGLKINEAACNAGNNVMIKSTFTGTMSLTDVVTGPSVYGNVVVEGGTMVLKNVALNGTVASHHGVHINGGTVSADGLTVTGAREAIYLSSGECYVSGGVLKDSKRHGVGVNTGKLTLVNTQIAGCTQDGINVWGECEIELTNVNISNARNGILLGASGSLTMKSGSISGSSKLDIDSFGSLTIGDIRVEKAIKSASVIRFTGSTVSKDNFIPLDVTGKSGDAELVKCHSNAVAQAVQGAFTLVGADGATVYVSGDTLCLGLGVAQVGDRKYSSLEAAVAAAQSGTDHTVILLTDVTVEDTIAITGEVILTDNGENRTVTRGSDAPLFNITGSLSLSGTASGKLIVDGADVKSSGTAFRVDGKLIVTNVDIKDVHSGAWSGNSMVYADGGSLLSFENVNISGGSGQMFYIQGAALDSKAHTFTNCTFKNYKGTANGSVFNSAPGAKVTVTGCTFENITNGAHGGVIYVDRSEYNISGSVLKGNSCGTAGGGAIAVSNQSGRQNTLNLTDCQFIGNTAGKGGAIWLRSSSKSQTTIVNCSFEGNRATANNGGAILVDENANLTLDGSSFSGNSASTGVGNDVYIYSAATAKHILKATDKPLTAQVHIQSGAISVAGGMTEGSSLTLNWANVPADTAVEFTSNETTAAWYKAIKLSDSMAESYHLAYSENMAKLVSGGESYKAMIGYTGYENFADALAAAIEQSNAETTVTIQLKADMTVDSTVIIPAGKNIIITDDGVARKLVRNTTGVMIEVNGTLSLNATGKNTLTVDGSSVAATGNAIKVNGVLNTDGAVISNLKGGTYNNAVLYLNTGSLVSMKDTEVKNNTGNFIYAQGAPAGTQSHSFENCRFADNSASAAGAVFNSAKKARFAITGCTFEGNIATGHGGAIYCDQSTYVIKNSTFKQNKTTGGHGGSITASQHASANVTIENCRFEENSSKTNANGKGGAIWARPNCTISITETVFVKNTSSKQGAAICCEGGSKVKIDGVTVSGSGLVAIDNNEEEGQ